MPAACLWLWLLSPPEGQSRLWAMGSTEGESLECHWPGTPSILAIPLLFDVCEYHAYRHPGLTGGVSLQVSPHAAHSPSCQSLVPSPHLIPPPSDPPSSLPNLLAPGDLDRLPLHQPPSPSLLLTLTSDVKAALGRVPWGTGCRRPQVSVHCWAGAHPRPAGNVTGSRKWYPWWTASMPPPSSAWRTSGGHSTRPSQTQALSSRVRSLFWGCLAPVLLESLGSGTQGGCSAGFGRLPFPPPPIHTLSSFSFPKSPSSQVSITPPLGACCSPPFLAKQLWWPYFLNQKLGPTFGSVRLTIQNWDCPEQGRVCGPRRDCFRRMRLQENLMCLRVCEDLNNFQRILGLANM